jgi:hypothetical protein
MRTKTRYRQGFKDGGKVEMPAKPEPIAATEMPPPAPPAVEQPPPPQPDLAKPPEDDATVALRRQIESLQKSEHLHRQQNEALLLAHAAHQRRNEWLKANPKAQANREALGPIHHEALQSGLIDTSPQYFAYLEQRLADLPADETPTMPQQPTPEFFRPPPSPPAPRPPGPNRVLHSAPVSRDVPTSGSGARPRGKVTLTPLEREAAAMSGVDLETYAKNKLRYQQMRESGEYRDSRDELRGK